MNLPLLLDAWAMWGVNIMDFVEAEQARGPVASERRASETRDEVKKTGEQLFLGRSPSIVLRLI